MIHGIFYKAEKGEKLRAALGTKTTPRGLLTGTFFVSLRMSLAKVLLHLRRRLRNGGDPALAHSSQRTEE
jgi:hypothetical protein